MKDFINNVKDDKFADAREELNTFVKDSIKERISASQEEMGIKIAIAPVVEDDIKDDDDNKDE